MLDEVSLDQGGRWPLPRAGQRAPGGPAVNRRDSDTADPIGGVHGYVRRSRSESVLLYHSQPDAFGSEVHTRRIGHAIVVSAAGELDAHARRELSAALVESATGDDDPVLVDLTNASVVDSTAIGVLLNALRRLTRQNRHLSLVIPPGPVRRSFELARLVDTFSVHSTLQAALAEAEAQR